MRMVENQDRATRGRVRGGFFHRDGARTPGGRLRYDFSVRMGQAGSNRVRLKVAFNQAESKWIKVKTGRGGSRAEEECVCELWDSRAVSSVAECNSAIQQNAILRYGAVRLGLGQSGSKRARRAVAPGRCANPQAGTPALRLPGRSDRGQTVSDRRSCSVRFKVGLSRTRTS
jgi:hypothetical protein